MNASKNDSDVNIFVKLVVWIFVVPFIALTVGSFGLFPLALIGILIG